jgi:hypothetical protein
VATSVSPPVDFRTRKLSAAAIDASGIDIGQDVYWKLYVIENVVRVLVHSILTVQIAPSWWTTAASPGIQRNVARIQATYAASPWHTSPGGHELYFTFLTELNEIIRANKNHFLPVIPDIDQWIARLEQVRLPRNVVGHMNWPSATDRQRIDVVYSDIQALLQHVSQAGIALLTP